VNAVPTELTIQFASVNINSSILRQEPDFMYASLLRDILLKIHSSEKEMMDFCKVLWADNEYDLNTIDEFETHNEARNAIF
jgi:hypothetical protein